MSCHLFALLGERKEEEEEEERISHGFQRGKKRLKYRPWRIFRFLFFSSFSFPFLGNTLLSPRRRRKMIFSPGVRPFLDLRGGYWY